MQIICAKATASIFGSRNSWSLSPIKGHSAEPTNCLVHLEIQGDEQNGYILVMSPEGFFAADSWYATENEARNAADELFSVPRDGWSQQGKSTRSNRPK